MQNIKKILRDSLSVFLQLSIFYAETVLEISENPGMLVRDHFVPCIVVVDWLRDCEICSLNSEKKFDARKIVLNAYQRLDQNL